jgi:hypothetical protein
LQRTSPEILFRQNDRIIVRSPNKDSKGDAKEAKVNVVTTPLASFLPGQAVRPQTAARQLADKEAK